MIANNAAAAASMALPVELVHLGGGNYRAVAGKPVQYASITKAAEAAGLARDTVYRLYKAGFVAGDQPSPKKIRIDLQDLLRHRKESMAEGWWTNERRARYLAGIRP